MRAFLLTVFTVDSALPVSLRRWSLLRMLRGWRKLRRPDKILRPAVVLLKSIVQRLDVPVSARLQRRCTGVLLHQFWCNFPTWQLLGPRRLQLLRVTLRISFLPLRLSVSMINLLT